MEASVLDRRVKLAYLVTHPIQYQAPLLKRLAQDEALDLHVIFQSDFSAKAYFDKGFSSSIQWDVPLMDGYSYTVLPKLKGTPDRVTTHLPINTGLMKLMRSFKPDILWVHGYGRPYNIYAAILALALGSRVLIRDDVHKLGKRRTWLRETVKSLQLTGLSRAGAAYLSIGKLNGDYYNELGVPREDIFFAPYAVDNAFFQKQIADARPKRAALRSSLGLDSSSPVILYAGKMHDRKRPADVLNAYSQMRTAWRSETPVPYLIYAGDGELLGQLKAAAEAERCERVRFLGFQNQHQLAALYDLCSVFVMPSASEPWGLVLNEVMNAGKPVIVTYECGCWPDLVKEGLNGYVIDVGDTAMLSRHLNELLTNQPLATSMGQESLRIINEWDFEADLVGIKHACETLMQRPRASLPR